MEIVITIIFFHEWKKEKKSKLNKNPKLNYKNDLNLHIAPRFCFLYNGIRII